MLDHRLFIVFLAAACILAITPGPGFFYVLTRTLAGGIREGISSSFGTFLGGFVHVVAAALGFKKILVVDVEPGTTYTSLSRKKVVNPGNYGRL